VASTCCLDLTPHPRVSAWLGRVLGRESMRRALADAQATVRPHAA